jgi:hypothetical protein
MLGGATRGLSALGILLLGCGGRAIASDDGGGPADSGVIVLLGVDASSYDASNEQPDSRSPAPCFANPGMGREIQPGQVYNRYYLLSVQLTGAPCGVYSFTVDAMTPTDSQIATAHLLKDGVQVATLTYFWQTTVTETQSFAFAFPGYLSITVRAAIGSLNLWDIPQDLFDGNHVVIAR